VILRDPNLHEMTGGGCAWTTHGSRTLPPSSAATIPDTASNSMSPVGSQSHTQLYSPFEKVAQLYAKNYSENLTTHAAA